MKRQSRLTLWLRRWLSLGGMLALLVIAPAQAAEVAARVQFVVGQVSATDAAGDRRRLHRGDEVYAGDTLHSAAASAAQLVFSDNGRMAIRANTVVRIEDYHFDANDRAGSNAFVALLRGAVRSITGLIGKYNKRNVVMVTPVATIGIRGTDYEVIHVAGESVAADVRGIAGTYNKVYSGATLLQSAPGTLPLDPGQIGFVGGSPGAAAAPVLIDALPDAVAEMLAHDAAAIGGPGAAEDVAVRDLLNGLLAENAIALDLNSNAFADIVNRAGATAAAAATTAGGAVGNATGAIGGIGGQLPGGGSLVVPLNTNQIELPRL